MYTGNLKIEPCHQDICNTGVLIVKGSRDKSHIDDYACALINYIVKEAL